MYTCPVYPVTGMASSIRAHVYTITEYHSNKGILAHTHNTYTTANRMYDNAVDDDDKGDANVRPLANVLSFIGEYFLDALRIGIHIYHI